MFDNFARTVGPGDPETWGPPTGHANDPRTDDPPEIVTTLQIQLQEIEDHLTQAKRALAHADYATTCTQVARIKEVAGWL